MSSLKCENSKLISKIFKIVLTLSLIFSFSVFNKTSVFAEEENINEQDMQQNYDISLQEGTYDESSVIVKFKDSTDSEACSLLSDDENKIADNTVKLNLQEGQSVAEAISELQNNSNVEYVEPNYLLTIPDEDCTELSESTDDASLLRTYINDPYQVYQWQLSDSISRVQDAWDLSKCNRNVTVAVLDSGIDVSHPDLKNNVIGGKSFVGGNALTDVVGHGTNVAGVISSQTNNGIGTSGVSYNAKLFSLQFHNSGTGGYASDFVKAVNWMIDNNSKYGVRIINASVGGYNTIKSLGDAINRAYNSGILVVCGSGNEASMDKNVYPAAYSNALAVGAVDYNHKRASFSNGGNFLDVVAPGVAVGTTGLNNKYFSVNGTSFSTPFVSGVAALCLAMNSDLTPAELKNCLTSTATHLGSSGKNKEYGYGQVNAYNAVNKAKSLKKSVNSMYRMYNQHTGEHFYTKDINEKYSLITAGWKYEGVGWYAPKSSKTPVYRLYNPYVNGGDHYYTTSGNEKNKLVKAGWKYEGIGWYSDDNKKVPVYQQYNKYAKTGTHNYTTSKSENDKLVKAGWKAEGIAWYGTK